MAITMCATLYALTVDIHVTGIVIWVLEVVKIHSTMGVTLSHAHARVSRIMKFSHEFLTDKLALAEPISSGHWRWGRIDSFVFEHDGHHYMADIKVHVIDGWQLVGGFLECKEVVKVERVAYEWVLLD